MNPQAQNNNGLYFIVGALVVAVGILSYLYFYKEGHSLWGKPRDEGGVHLRIDEGGVSGTIKVPEDKK